MAIGQAVTTATWDMEVDECKRCICRVSKRLKQRQARLRHKLRRRSQRQLLNRPQCILANMEELRQEHLVRLGQNLVRSIDRLRSFFRRVADRERDQHVTTISQRHGPAFKRNMTIADELASEWPTVLGVVHRSEPLDGLAETIERFATIPSERVLPSEDNTGLLDEITDADVLSAIAGLSRQKSAGPDGLNNDFYKDTPALLASACSGQQ